MLLQNTSDESTNSTSSGRRRAFLVKVYEELQGKPVTLTTLLTTRKTLNIRMWNIRTMFESGKTAQVAREMHNYNLVLLGLCETRWKQSGKLRLTTGEMVLYSGHDHTLRDQQAGFRPGRSCIDQIKRTSDKGDGDGLAIRYANHLVASAVKP